MEVVRSNGIDDSRQNVEIVIACDGIRVDSSSCQLDESGFERTGGLKKPIVVIDNVPTQGDQIDLFLDRQFNDCMPHSRTGKPPFVYRVRYPCGAPTDVNVGSGENPDGHCPVAL
jgi:hypothetical protein